MDSDVIVVCMNDFLAH
jgi:superfamily II DNA/RNA helicase